jgi:murein DD-endopeptidase MepM/ murein hydrolase activator NlpD
MDDSLTTLINGITPLFKSTTPPASSTQSAASDPFSQILSSAMFSGGLSSSGSSLGSSMGSSSTSNFLLPLMLVLLEELLSQQVSPTSQTQDSSGSTTPTAAAAQKASSAQAEHSSTETRKVSDSKSPQGRPVGGVLTQGFHTGHNGLDFGVPVGTSVKATMSGKVVYAGWNNQGYGNLVIVENGPYRTYFAHLSGVPVKVGDTVSAGSVIGKSGNTGNSTGPHVHYEVRLNSKPIDPTSFTLKK